MYIKKALFLVIIFALGFLSYAEPLSASCCGSGALGGTGDLRAHERASFEMSEDFRFVSGIFKDDIFLAERPEHLPYFKFTHNLKLVTRLAPFFLPFVIFPIVTQVSSQSVGSSFGDLSLGARLPIFKQAHDWRIVSLTAIASLGMPSGRLSGQDNIFEATRITTMGAWMLNLGALLERSFGNMTYSLSYSLAFDLAYFRPPEGFMSGIKHRPGLGLTWAVNEKIQVSANLDTLWQNEAQFNGYSIPESSARKMSLSLSYSYFFHSHLTLLGTLGSDLALSYLGKNQDAEIFTQIGLRTGVF
jgi:hypothetical protein